jgi:DNA polymerase-3 subunit gamma/tau
MGKALYRKYRSTSLDEIVGQDHITTTLSNALKQGRISHAYLLTGPRGVGKTSIARILAHAVNGLDYSEDQHLDIIEIDAASNNGVEDVRSLRDKILSSPVSAHYKVFIIDEVHMLSKAAFNALLKTLEEPPAHVIFILATTEAYKLPETIISRTQRFSFRPVPESLVVKHLKEIAGKEAITIDDDALELIAAHGEGSFRDSISLLDQASSINNHVRKQDVEQLLGRAPSELTSTLLKSISGQNMAGCIASLSTLLDQGYEAATIAMQISQLLRQGLTGVTAQIMPMQRVLALLQDLLDVPGSNNPRALLEIVVLRHAAGVQNEATAQQLDAVEQPKTISSSKPTIKPTEAALNEVTETLAIAEPAEPNHDEKQSPQFIETELSSDSTVDELWQKVLQTIKKSHNTLYGIARMARPSLEGDVLTLELTFAFHQKRLTEPHNRAVLTKIIEELRQAPTKVVCTVSGKQSASSANNDSVITISNIFGGAELLES